MSIGKYVLDGFTSHPFSPPPTAFSDHLILFRFSSEAVPRVTLTRVFFHLRNSIFVIL